MRSFGMCYTFLVCWILLSFVSVGNAAATVDGSQALTGSFIGAPITFTGTGFVDGCIVILGSGSTAAIASNYTTATKTNCNANYMVDATNMQCVTPSLTIPASAKYYLFVLCDGEAQSALSDATFTPTAPTVTSISPAAVSVYGGTSVTVVGTNLGCGCTVSFTTTTTFSATGALTCLSPTVNSAGTQIACTTPTTGLAYTAPGTKYYTWITCGAQTSAAGVGTAWYLTTGAPTITSVSPAAPSCVGAYVTIVGTNFGPGCTVGFVTAAAVTVAATGAVTNAAGTSITCYTGTMIAATAYNARVTCPGYSAVTSAGTVTPGAPTLTGIKVNGAGSSTTEVTVTYGVATTIKLVGTKFGAGCQGFFTSASGSTTADKTLCTSTTNTSSTATELECVVPSTLSNSLWWVWVQCGASTQGTSVVTLTPVGSVTVASVSPTTGAGIGAELTVTGTNFGTGCVVVLADSLTDPTSGAVNCDATSITSTVIKCTAGDLEILTATPVPYYPWVQCGSGAFFAPPSTVSFTAETPTVTGASTTGQTASTTMSSVQGASQTLTLTGTNFGTGCTVDLNTVATGVAGTSKPCVNVVVSSPTTLTCILDPTMVDAVPYYARVDCGSGTNSAIVTSTVTVTPAAVACAVSPTITAATYDGAILGGKLSLTGTGLGSDCTYAFRVTAATAGTQILCTLTEVSSDGTTATCLAAAALSTAGSGYLATVYNGAGAQSEFATRVTAARVTVSAVALNGVTASGTSASFPVNSLATLLITGTKFGAKSSASDVCLVGFTTGATPAYTTVCTNVQYVSATQISCKLPTGLSTGSSYNVWVNCDGVGSTAANGNVQFATKLTPAAVSTTASWNPDDGSSVAYTAVEVDQVDISPQPGTLLTITGLPQMYSGCTFNIGKNPGNQSGVVPCTNPTLLSATAMTCLSPPLTADVDTTYYLYATCGSNMYHAATTPITVTADATMVIFSVSPSTLSAAGGETVTLTGSGLSGTTVTVTVCGVDATSEVDSGTTLTFTAPALELGNCAVSVDIDGVVPAGTAFVTVAAPTITSVSPTSFPSVDAGQTLTVTGTNFASACTLSIGGAACVGTVTVTGSTVISCDDTPLSAGSVSVKVTCGTSSVAAAVSAVAKVLTSTAVTTTQLNRSTAPLAVSLDGSPIVITGTGFASTGCTVTVGDAVCTLPTFISSTSVSCITPTLSPGLYPVVVTCNSFISTGNTFVNATAPAVTLVAPLVTALEGTPLTVTGNYFGTRCTVWLTPVGSSAVECTGAVRTSNMTMTCTTPQLSAATGIVVSVLCNAVRSTETSIFITASKPTVTGTSVPSIGLIGANVTVIGTNFGAGCIINFKSGDVVDTCTTSTYVSSTSMLCFGTPTYSAATTGIIVSVTCNSVASASASVSVSAAAPTVSAATSTIGLIGSVLTVTGNYFGAGCTVSLTPSAAAAGPADCLNVHVDSATSISCITPQLAAQTGLAAKVTCNSVTSTTFASVTAALPTVTGVSTSATATSTVMPMVSTTLYVAGTNFGAGCTVKLYYSGSGYDCGSPVYVSSTMLACLAAGATINSAAVSGIVVKATCSGYETTSTSVTLSTAGPTVTGMAVDDASPSTTAIGSTAGSKLTVYGANYGSTGCSVKFSVWCSTLTCDPFAVALSVSSFSTRTTSSLTISSGSMVSLSAGVYLVQVTCGGLTSTATTTLYTVTTPTLSSVSPAVIPASYTDSTYLLTLTGTNFGADCTVAIGATPTMCTNVAYVSSTTLTCQAPSMAVATAQKVVVSCYNIPSTATTVTVTPSLPVVSTVSPLSISLSGGSFVAVAGNYFAPGCLVSLGGTSCLNSVYLSATQLACATPASTLGGNTTIDLAASVACQSSASNATVTTAKAVAGLPTVGVVTPSIITTAPRTLVTIAGSYYAQTGCIASINSKNCQFTTVASSTSIICTTPSDLSNVTGGVVSVACNSQNSNSSTTMTVNAPTLASVSPTTISTAGGIITVTGLNFASGCLVSLGSVDCVSTSYVYIGSTQIQCQAPGIASETAQQVTVVCGPITLTSASITVTPTAPTTTTASPATITAASTVITVQGTYFYTGCVAYLDTTACSTTTIVSATQLLCVTPTALMPATYALTVDCNTVDSAAASAPAIKLIPSITSVAPLKISTVGGQTINVYGTGLSSDCTVTIGGNACLTPAATGTTQLSCTSPAFSAAGSVAVFVTCNSLNSVDVVNGNVVPPSLTQITSDVLVTNAGGQTATITGDGFQSGCTITIGSTDCASPAVAGALSNGVYTSMTCTTPQLSGTSALAVAVTCGSVKSTQTAITVTPSTGGAVTATGVTTTDPMSTYGGGNITVDGTGFGTGCTVSVGSTSCTAVLVFSSAQLQCTAPSATEAGSKNVTVTCDATTTSGLPVVYVAPALTSASSDDVSTAGGFTANIAGSGFITGCSVKISTADCTDVEVLSSSNLTCTAPQLAAGDHAVVVTCGTVASNSTVNITYVAPTVASVAPAIVRTTSGSVVMINGTGFAPACTFTVGGTACISSTFVSSMLMSCVTPTLTAGSANVVALCGGSTAGFTSGNSTGAALSVAPSIESVTSPILVTAAGGPTLTINGAGFVSGCTVVLGTTPCTASLTSSNAITCVAPALPAGPHAATVTCNNVSSVGRAVAIVYPLGNFSGPMIANVTTDVLSTAGGQIFISGSNFAAGCSVTVGAVACTDLVALSSTLMTCMAPAPVEAGGQTVVVTCGTKVSSMLNGTGTMFNVTYGAPTMASVAPTSITTDAGTLISVTGTNFDDGCTVTMGGLACTSPVFSSTTINCTAPMLTIGTADVAVTCGTITASGVSVSVATFVPPTVAGVSIASGSVMTAGASTVPLTVTGSGFTPGCTVTVGNAGCTDVNVYSPTTLSCDYPTKATGAHAVAVTCGSFTSSEVVNTFYTIDGTVPKLSSAPATISTAGGAITLVGDTLATGCTATIGGVACSSPMVLDASTLKCTAPALAPGSKAVVITCGVTPSVEEISITYTSPTVSNAMASAPDAKSPIATITVNGTSLTAGCSISVGYAACKDPEFTGATATCMLPGPLVAGQQAVVVTCGGVSTVSTSPLAVPALVTAVMAPKAVTSTGGFTLQVAGAGFPSSDCIVMVDSLNCSSTTYVSAELLNCTTPAGTVGPHSVSVTCSHVPSIEKTTVIYGPANLAPSMTYLATPMPLWTSGGVPIMINGSNFATGCSVAVNNNDCGLPSTLSPTALVCMAPPVNTATNYSVVVTCTGTSNAMPITYGTPSDVPYVYSVSGPIGTGGGNVTINGTASFATGCTVKIANSSCTWAMTTNRTRISCVAPANDVGAQSVAVTCGKITSNTNITVLYVLPKASSIAPASMPTAGNVSVTLTGEGFGPFCSVRIADKPCNTTQPITPTAIVCLAPANAAGVQTVTIMCGSYANTDLKLTYVAPPTPSPSPSPVPTPAPVDSANQKPVSLAINGVDTNSLDNDKEEEFLDAASTDLCKEIQKTQPAATCDTAATKRRRNLLQSSSVTTTVSYAAGTTQEQMQAAQTATVAAINANYKAVFASLVAAFPGITGVTAKDLGVYFIAAAPPPPSDGEDDDDKKKKLAIGLGVGLGVGIPVVAALIFFCIWKSKRSAAGVVAPRGEGTA